MLSYSLIAKNRRRISQGRQLSPMKSQARLRLRITILLSVNFSFASAEANIENLFLNAQEIMTTEGKKKLIFRSDDIAKTDKAIINIAVPVRAYYETVTYFHEKKSTSQATAQKNEAVDNAKKLLKETDVQNSNFSR